MTVVQAAGSGNELIQQAHYYPFGMEIRGDWKFDLAQSGMSNQYQYNGKELNEDYGLHWNDYGARWYDAALGRWQAIDPLAENYVTWSGYNYVMNNPIHSIDPDGKRVIIRYKENITKKNGKVVVKNRKYVYKIGEKYTGANEKVRETIEGLNYIIENNLDYLLVIVTTCTVR